jgi:hypothetical protein
MPGAGELECVFVCGITPIASAPRTNLLSEVTNAAEDYATQWGVPWIAPQEIRIQRAWYLLFRPSRIEFRFDGGSGSGFVLVTRPRWTIRIYEFYPKTNADVMLPWWAAYPDFSSVTIGWRMGSGEVYKHRWYAWYRNLSREQRTEYRHRFPTPEFGAWEGWYEQIADVPAEPDSITDLIFGRVP